MSKVAALPQKNYFNNESYLSGYRDYLSRSDYSPQTIKIYLSSIQGFFEFLEIPLGQLNEMHLIQYRDYMQNVRNLKPATINKNLFAVKVFVQYLFEAGALKVNYGSQIKTIKMQKKSSAPKVLTDAEVRLLMQTLARVSKPFNKYRNAAILQLAVNAGLRVGELCALNYGDIAINDRSGQVHIQNGKGMKERYVFLNKKARHELSEYINMRVQKSKKSIEDSEPLFLTERNTRVSVRSVEYFITHIAKESKITRLKITPHVLRHTFATNYYQKGEDVLGLSRMLGHSSLDTTGIYALPSEEQILLSLDKI